MSNITSTCFAILAAPRSGSSVLSGIVHSLGINMGSNLLKPNAHNEKGFFEDIEFLEIHRHMYGTIPYLFDDPVVKQTDTIIPAYINLIRKKCTQRVWGVKDPRMVFLIEEFKKYLNSSCQLKLITTQRPVHLSAKSMGIVLGIDYERALVISNRYEKARIETIKKIKEEGLPLLEITYEELMTNTKECVKKIADFCGVTDEPTIEMAGLLVDKSLWHNR